MKIIIEAEAKEIADLVLRIQGRLKSDQTVTFSEMVELAKRIRERGTPEKVYLDDRSDVKVMTCKVMRDGVRIDGKSYFATELFYSLGCHVKIIALGECVYRIKNDTIIPLEEL